jgi:hypothetical protein
MVPSTPYRASRMKVQFVKNVNHEPPPSGLLAKLRGPTICRGAGGQHGGSAANGSAVVPVIEREVGEQWHRLYAR